MFWWIRFLFLSAVAVFFLEFGVEEMIRAYHARNPYDFLGSFFAASFIILISGTLLVAFIWRMILRGREKSGETGKGENRENKTHTTEGTEILSEKTKDKPSSLGKGT